VLLYIPLTRGGHYLCETHVAVEPERKRSLDTTAEISGRTLTSLISGGPILSVEGIACIASLKFPGSQLVRVSD